MIDWTAIITAGLAILGSYAGNMAISQKKSREQAIEDAKREQRQEDHQRATDERLDSIERKLDIHNHYADRIGGMEKNIAVMNETLKNIEKGAK